MVEERQHGNPRAMELEGKHQVGSTMVLVPSIPTMAAAQPMPLAIAHQLGMLAPRLPPMACSKTPSQPDPKHLATAVAAMLGEAPRRPHINPRPRTIAGPTHKQIMVGEGRMLTMPQLLELHTCLRQHLAPTRLQLQLQLTRRLHQLPILLPLQVPTQLQLQQRILLQLLVHTQRRHLGHINQRRQLRTGKMTAQDTWTRKDVGRSGGVITFQSVVLKMAKHGKICISA